MDKDINNKREKRIKEISNIYEGSKLKDFSDLKETELKQAAAFKIDQDSKEVELLAIGVGEYANLIEEEAAKYDIPIYKDKELTNELVKFEINTNLPSYMYDVIVQTINFIAKLDYKYGKHK